MERKIIWLLLESSYPELPFMIKYGWKLQSVAHIPVCFHSSLHKIKSVNRTQVSNQGSIIKSEGDHSKYNLMSFTFVTRVRVKVWVAILGMWLCLQLQFKPPNLFYNPLNGVVIHIACATNFVLPLNFLFIWLDTALCQ